MNNTQQQQAQQFIPQQGNQKAPTDAAKQQTPATVEEITKIAQLGYN